MLRSHTDVAAPRNIFRDRFAQLGDALRWTIMRPTLVKACLAASTMCAGVGKSGSPISRWTMLRPLASSALARTNTSNAPSTAMRSIRSAASCDLPEKRNTGADFHARHAVVYRDRSPEIRPVTRPPESSDTMAVW